MPVLRVLPFFTFVFLAGCMMPRPWLAPAATGPACAPATSLSGVEIFTVTFRAADCQRRPLRYTKYRSSTPGFGIVRPTQSDGRTTYANLIAPPDDWWNKLDSKVAAAGNRAPVLYIHGYNNSHDFAVRRARAIRASLLAQRPVIALTWPSYNKITPYPWDEANNEWVRDVATKFIADVATKYDGTIIIAHSMGNRILIDALESGLVNKDRLGRVILASADVDREHFARRLYRQNGLGVPATIYASRADQILSTSWRAHGSPRAGDLSYWVSGRTWFQPYYLSPKSEIIDTTAVRANLKGHADFIEGEEGAADLCRLIAGLPTAPWRNAVDADRRYFELTKNPQSDECTPLGERAAAIANGKA